MPKPSDVVRFQFKPGSPSFLPDAKTIAYFFHSCGLFRIATRAANSVDSHLDVLVVVVFSVISAEAFINEIAEAASDITPEEESAPRKLRAFAELAKQGEEAHGSLQFKYRIARWVFSGEIPDKGLNPYQDFDLLEVIWLC